MNNTPPDTGAFFARDRDWHPQAYVPIYKTSVVRSPQKALLSFDSTRTEITGPAFGHNMLGQLDNDLILNYAKPGEMAEVSPTSIALADAIARRIVSDGGAALFIDYGPAASGVGDSFQALLRHRFHDPLANPGEADLTAHVDFAALALAAQQAGAATFGPITQGDFLRSLGLELRADMLAAKADASTAEILRRQCRRLIAPDEMGRLFKALALAQPDIKELAGL